MVKSFIEIIGLIFLLVFAATMFYQGAMIFRGEHGYKHMEREEIKMINIRKRVEKLLKEK